MRQTVAKMKFRSLSGQKMEDISKHFPLMRDLMTVLGVDGGMTSFEETPDSAPRKLHNGDSIYVGSVKSGVVTIGVPGEDGNRRLFRVRPPVSLPVGTMVVKLEELKHINWRAKAEEMRQAAEEAERQKKISPPPMPKRPDRPSPAPHIPPDPRPHPGPKIMPVDGDVLGAPEPLREVFKPSFKPWGKKLLTPQFKRVLAKIFPAKYADLEFRVAIRSEMIAADMGDEHCELGDVSGGALGVVVLALQEARLWRYESEIQLRGDIPEREFRLALSELASPVKETPSPDPAPPPDPSDDGEGDKQSEKKPKPRTPKSSKTDALLWLGISKNPEAQDAAILALHAAVDGTEDNILWTQNKKLMSVFVRHLPSSMGKVDGRSMGKGLHSLSEKVNPSPLTRHCPHGVLGYSLSKLGLARITELTGSEAEKVPQPGKVAKVTKPSKQQTKTSPPVEKIENEVSVLAKLVKPQLKKLKELDEFEAARAAVDEEIERLLAKLPVKALKAWRRLSEIKRQVAEIEDGE